MNAFSKAIQEINNDITKMQLRLDALYVAERLVAPITDELGIVPTIVLASSIYDSIYVDYSFGCKGFHYDEVGGKLEIVEKYGFKVESTIDNPERTPPTRTYLCRLSTCDCEGVKFDLCLFLTAHLVEGATCLVVDGPVRTTKKMVEVETAIQTKIFVCPEN